MNAIVAIANLPTIGFELLRKEVPVWESPVVKPGDVLEFPESDEICFRHECSKHSLASKEELFVSVYRNGKPSWILLLCKIQDNPNSPTRVTYDMAHRFGYKTLDEMLKELCSIHKPITVSTPTVESKGLSW